MGDATLDAFIAASVVPRDAWHASGTLDRARQMLSSNPGLAGTNIHTAAVVGDDASVKQFVERDAATATARGGPYGWDPLTHLCFSRYLKLDSDRSAAFVRAAQILLDAGADPNTGFYERDHQPEPEWESVLYGAAGVAHHAGVTRLLIERGAEVNDGEVAYHSPESYELDAMKVVVETGRLTADSLATMLLRKHDIHDLRGVAYLLEHGASPNHPTHWGVTALHQAIARDNATEIVVRLLEHGADPSLVCRGRSAFARAARRGRGDLLALFEERGLEHDLVGIDRLVAACARHDAAAVRKLVREDSTLGPQLLTDAGTLLAEFAGNDNAVGVAMLIDLGVDIDAPFADGDGYWGVAPNSTALHVAAWRASHETVRLLVERGATVDGFDGKGRTPLFLAVKACVDSYWTDLRAPDSVRTLLDAGASTAGVPFPSGYEPVDVLLRASGAQEKES